jgi:hypothetical protein
MPLSILTLYIKPLNQAKHPVERDLSEGNM